MDQNMITPIDGQPGTRQEDLFLTREELLMIEVSSLTRNELLLLEVDRLTNALASLQTAHIELQAHAASSKALSVESLVVSALSDKVPELIEREIEKQFIDFYAKEIEKRVKEHISAYLEDASIDCEPAVKAAIQKLLAGIEIKFGCGY